MPRLVVDVSPLHVPRVWRIAGGTWAILHLLILLFGGDPNALSISSFTGLLVAIAASLLGAVDRPRAHSASVSALLFALFMVVSLFTPLLRSPGIDVLRGWILFTLGLFVPLYLLRDRRLVLLVSWAGLGFAAILALRSVLIDLPASWVLPRNFLESSVPLLAYRYAAYATVQLLVVASAIPWVIAGGKRAAYVAALPLALIVYSIATLAFELPEWMSYMPEGQGSWSTVSPILHYSLFALFFAVLSLVYLVKQSLKERKRWRKFGLRSGLLTGGWIAGILTLISLFFLPLPAYPWVMTAGGFLLGMGFAARESLVRDDPTRNPRRRPIGWKGHLEELGIAVQSLAAAGWRRLLFRTPKELDTAPPARKIIDSASERVHIPYEEGRPRWVPVVFHMHSNRWEGAFTPQEMVEHYSRLGAGAVILTDHNRVTASGHTHGEVTGYEHGWGPHHHHVLALGAKRTIVDRYPFGGTIATRAETITRLRSISPLIILAHPRHGDAWDSEDVTSLDFDALELFNKSMDDFEPWDQALTSGLLVWGTAGDDCHDLRSRHQTGKRYLLVDIREGSDPKRKGAAHPEAVLDALRQGRFIAVRHLSREVTRALPDDELPRIEMFAINEGELTVRFDRPVNYAEIVGPGGEVTTILKQQQEFKVSPAKGRGYARLVIFHGNHTMTLNPVARIQNEATLP